MSKRLRRLWDDLTRKPAMPQKVTDMAQFRKKSVVIDAVQYDGNNKDAIPCLCNCTGEKNPHIHTLEGQMYAKPGDWIIKGWKGEFYPCKPDIFAQTYEPVEE